MLILVDSNVLIYSADPPSPFHQSSVDACDILRQRGDTLCVIPQNLIEFWAVVTRPATKRGLGFSTAQAQAELTRIKRLFRLLPDTADIFTEWETLVGQHAIAGALTHDARIAAAMKVYGVTHILTTNLKDFRLFPHLTPIDPAIVTSPSPLTVPPTV